MGTRACAAVAMPEGGAERGERKQRGDSDDGAAAPVASVSAQSDGDCGCGRTRSRPGGVITTEIAVSEPPCRPKTRRLLGASLESEGGSTCAGDEERGVSLALAQLSCLARLFSLDADADENSSGSDLASESDGNPSRQSESALAAVLKRR